MEEEFSGEREIVLSKFRERERVCVFRVKSQPKRESLHESSEAAEIKGSQPRMPRVVWGCKIPNNLNNYLIAHI